MIRRRVRDRWVLIAVSEIVGQTGFSEEKKKKEKNIHPDPPQLALSPIRFISPV